MNLYNIILCIGLTTCSMVIACSAGKNIAPKAALNSDYLIEGDFTILETDKLGHLYLVNSDNELLQYNSELKLLYKFSINTLGDISFIDVSNPQKILLYYPDFQFIVFVDNTLSEIKRLNLETMGFWDVQGVALSNDNLIWIYDPVNYRLIKIDEIGNVILGSNESFFGELDDVFRPKVYAKNSSVYLYSENEVMLFDLFGQHIKTMSLRNEKIQFFDNQLMILNNSALEIVDLKLETFEETNNNYYQSENLKIKNFSLQDKTLFLLDENGVLKIED